jgi:hypothetical protein
MASVCDECQCTPGICRLSSRRTSRFLSGLRYSSRHHRGFDSDQVHHRYNDLQSPIVSFDSFTSLLVQYQHEEITQIAQLVEQKLEALVAEVTADGGAS